MSVLRTILLEPLFNALLLIYALLPNNDFGVAVIILTVIIRIILWPLVKRQLNHQKAMRDIQPEINKIKAQAKGDKQKESQLMVELFKEKDINPFASLGLALVQFPVLIALYYVLSDASQAAKIQEAAYSFVANLPAVQEIINNPGSFHPTLFGVVDMTKPSIVLAVLAGAAQYVQAKQLTPKKTDKGSGFAANLGFNATLIFPVLTVAIGVRFPSALALYWFTSSVIAVFQQHLVFSEEVTLIGKLTPKPLRKTSPVSENKKIIDVKPTKKTKKGKK